MATVGGALLLLLLHARLELLPDMGGAALNTSLHARLVICEA